MLVFGVKLEPALQPLWFWPDSIACDQWVIVLLFACHSLSLVTLVVWCCDGPVLWRCCRHANERPFDAGTLHALLLIVLLRPAVRVHQALHCQPMHSVPLCPVHCPLRAAVKRQRLRQRQRQRQVGEEEEEGEGFEIDL